MTYRGLFLGVLLFALSTVVVSAQQYQPTPHETIASDVTELYRIGGEREVRNYATWQPCLTVHRDGDALVFYWWCSRFKLIDEAYRLEGVY